MHSTSASSGFAVAAWGFFLTYLTVAVPMLVALVRKQAPISQLLSAALFGIPLTLIAGIAIAALSPVTSALGIDSKSVLQLIFGITTCIAIGYGTGLFLARRSSSSDSSYRRGAVVAHGDSKPRMPGQLTLAGLPIAKEDETKHFKFVGTTGTGKSTAIREILSSALERGDRAVIADPESGYLNNFYDASRGDIILNPFSPEGLRWNPLDEITNDYDVDQLARSLIADTGDSDRIWPEHARTFFIAVTQQLVANGVKNDAELYRLLIKAPLKELRGLLAGTSAGPLLEEGNEKMFGSVRGTATSAIRSLEYTTRQQTPYFSVRNWVRQGSAKLAGGRGGVLFIPYKAGEIAAVRSLISAWVRIAIFEAMDRPEGDQHLWFIVDELDALGAIDGLKDALARLRKFGGRVVIGLQSIAQVSGTYGKAAADTIVENCGNTVILRCSASERGGTSEFASKLIGQREVMHTTRSITRRLTEWFGGSITTSQQLRIEPAVMASEIERLPDLGGFLKFASTPDWTRVRLTRVTYPIRERPWGAAVDTPPPPAAAVVPVASPTSAAPPAASAAVPAEPTKPRAPARPRARKQQDGVSRAQATGPGKGTADGNTHRDDGGAQQGDTIPPGGSDGAAAQRPAPDAG